MLFFRLAERVSNLLRRTAGKYNLTHLSYANEAERSSDVVTATWVDEELRESNLVKFQWSQDSGLCPFPRISIPGSFGSAVDSTLRMT